MRNPKKKKNIKEILKKKKKKKGKKNKRIHERREIVHGEEIMAKIHK